MLVHNDAVVQGLEVLFMTDVEHWGIPSRACDNAWPKSRRNRNNRPTVSAQPRLQSTAMVCIRYCSTKLNRLAVIDVVTTCSPNLMEKIMDENRVVGTAKNIGGKVQEGFGRVMGDAKSQVEGVTNQVKGAAQDLYGQAHDSVSQIADAAADTAASARQSAASFEGALRDTIETQPYTAVLAALALGWLFGRMHRPV